MKLGSDTAWTGGSTPSARTTDKKGNVVIQPQYDQIVSFQEGLALVRKENKWGCIDRNGKIIIDYHFDKINFQELPIGFRNGLCVVVEGSKWGYIDKTGNYVWQSE